MAISLSSIQKKYLVLLGLFLLSVLVRLPHLDRPLSKHHEFCTALVLLTLDIWEEEGAAKFYYNPVVTYGNAGDEGLNNLVVGIVQREGRYYYLSYPPLGFILPHLVFSTLGISSSPLALQLYNIAWHLLSAYLLYGIICLLLGWREKAMFPPAVVGFAAYLFAPVCLWFHGNAYMSDLFVSNFIILGIWVVLNIFVDNKQADWRWILGIGAAVFLMMYTTWIAGLFAGAVFMLSCWYSRSDWNFLWVALSVSLGMLLALALTTWQFSQLDGLDTVVAYIKNRFLDRSSVPSSRIKVLYYILKTHMLTGFLPLLLWLVGWSVYYFFKKKSLKISISKPLGIFLAVAAFPILLHHLLFIEYTAVHDFAVLKTGILIAVWVGLLYHSLNKIPARLKSGTLLAALLLCVAQYYVINRPGAINQNGDAYAYMQDIGLAIAKEQLAEAVVFLEGHKANAQILYYAGRNVIPVKSKEAAKSFMKKEGISSGLYVKVKDKKVVEITNF